MKATIQKQLSEGEMIVVEVEGKNPEELGARLALTWPVLEQRLQNLNDRVQTVHPLVEPLPPEIKQAVHGTLAILFGKPGGTEQLKMVLEEIARKEAELQRLKATYEPEQPASTIAEAPALVTENDEEIEEIEDLDVEDLEEVEPANG